MQQKKWMWAAKEQVNKMSWMLFLLISKKEKKNSFFFFFKKKPQTHFTRYMLSWRVFGETYNIL